MNRGLTRLANVRHARCMRSDDTMKQRMRTPGRVAIIGAGHVGATFAFALVRSGAAAEVVIVDIDPARAEGEAMDLDHVVPFGRPVRIEVGGYEACAGADVVVITAGAGDLRKGETRLDLAVRNAIVFREVVPRVVDAAPDAVFVVATNPVDVMTMLTRELAGIASSRVMGSGTVLDTARLRFLLAKRFDVDAANVHAHVIGEHGDSEVIAWSTANVGGVQLDELVTPIPFDDVERDAMARTTREAAYEVIARKGYTSFAIAGALVRIVTAIMRDERAVLSVSSPVSGAYGLTGVCLSLPSIVGRDGVERVLNLALDVPERVALARSAEAIRASAVSAGLDAFTSRERAR